RAWICCVLEFKNRQRVVMGPGYTELFFWDEACALAAGHRPCFECRRADALAFAFAWSGEAVRATAPQMDRDLAKARAEGPWICDAAPEGAMVALPEGPALVAQGALHLWSPDGYGASQPLPRRLRVLTPRPICTVLARGYRPQMGLNA
ncbi:MAG: hypothetical protein AAFR93_00605, partial [Pseudomonadota bacterium]